MFIQTQEISQECNKRIGWKYSLEKNTQNHQSLKKKIVETKVTFMLKLNIKNKEKLPNLLKILTIEEQAIQKFKSWYHLHRIVLMSQEIS